MGQGASTRPELIEGKRFVVKWKAITIDFEEDRFTAERFLGHLNFFYDLLDRGVIQPGGKAGEEKT
jgi:hypothetical protein